MTWGDRAAEQYEKDQPSTYEPCKLHEITRCSICTGLDKRLKSFERSSEFGGFTSAKHPGKCPKCGETFDVGTTIYATDGGWICCP